MRCAAVYPSVPTLAQPSLLLYHHYCVHPSVPTLLNHPISLPSAVHTHELIPVHPLPVPAAVLIQFVGNGAFGRVYRAELTAKGAKEIPGGAAKDVVAVKEVLIGQDTAKHEFDINEKCHGATNVVQTIAYFKNDVGVFIVMEFLGLELGKYVASEPTPPALFTPPMLPPSSPPRPLPTPLRPSHPPPLPTLCAPAPQVPGEERRRYHQ